MTTLGKLFVVTQFGLSMIFVIIAGMFLAQHFHRVTGNGHNYYVFSLDR